MDEKLVLLMVFLPLISFLVTGPLRSNAFAKIFAPLCIVISAVLSCLMFCDVVLHGKIISLVLTDWISSSGLNFNWSLKIDQLSSIMISVVTIVSASVHCYSVGYMSEDKNISKFMALLSLFTFFMLMLVVSDNIIQLFFGWEGVGLCSYFLIGYWYQKESACKAAIKAFIVNRIADVFFAIGIFSIYVVFNSVSFDVIFSGVTTHLNDTITIFGINFNAINFICLMLFVGCMGKSAQIGFHTWLPDAMEGPTPVSALIHAATMVTAGVFLVARCSPLFEHSPIILNLIAAVGATTAIFAATIALVEKDIKRIIAYSTCSQLGYMFFACGMSAYNAAIFHLATHAFFKALLFLCAGNVIHAVHEQQDITKMGGLAKKLPYTYSMMLVGLVALCGIWPLAGFYSKDAILEIAYTQNPLVYIVGVTTALLTAFYSFRLLYSVFHAEPRAKHATHIHEAPVGMLLSLSALVVGSVFAGWYGHQIGILDFSSFWKGSLFFKQNFDIAHLSTFAKFIPTVLVLIGIEFGLILYRYKLDLLNHITTKLRFLHTLLLNQYFINEVYAFIFVRPFSQLTKTTTSFVEILCIDGCGPNMLAKSSVKIAAKLRLGQNGYVYTYGLVMLLGVAAFLMWYVVVKY